MIWRYSSSATVAWSCDTSVHPTRAPLVPRLGCAALQLAPETRVLVTGASRGIGRAIGRSFAARGCEIGVVARQPEGLEGVPGEALAADVSDPESIGRAVDQ